MLPAISRHGKIRIGVLGYRYSGRFFDTLLAAEVIGWTLDLMRGFYPRKNIVVVSELVDFGVPGIAYSLAAMRGLRTVGIACPLAENCRCFPVDEKRIVGNSWGDEIATFLQEIDLLVRVGNSPRFTRQVNAFVRMGKPAFEFDLPLY